MFKAESRIGTMQLGDKFIKLHLILYAIEKIKHDICIRVLMNEIYNFAPDMHTY